MKCTIEFRKRYARFKFRVSALPFGIHLKIKRFRVRITRVWYCGG